VKRGAAEIAELSRLIDAALELPYFKAPLAVLRARIH